MSPSRHKAMHKSCAFIVTTAAVFDDSGFVDDSGRRGSDQLFRVDDLVCFSRPVDDDAGDVHERQFFDGGGRFSQQVVGGDDGQPSQQEEGKNKQPSQWVFVGQPEHHLLGNEQHIPRQTKKPMLRKKFYISCELLFNSQNDTDRDAVDAL